MIISIDPAPIKSGIVFSEGMQIKHISIEQNAEIRRALKAYSNSVLAIENIKSYGMSVGQSVFDTCIEIGRFIECFNDEENTFLHTRKEIVTYICGSSKAKDSNVRQSLIDLYSDFYKMSDKEIIGTKKNKGPLYGVSKDMWSALAVSVYHQKLINK